MTMLRTPQEVVDFWHKDEDIPASMVRRQAVRQEWPRLAKLLDDCPPSDVLAVVPKPIEEGMKYATSNPRFRWSPAAIPAAIKALPESVTHVHFSIRNWSLAFLIGTFAAGIVVGSITTTILATL